MRLVSNLWKHCTFMEVADALRRLYRIEAAGSRKFVADVISIAMLSSRGGNLLWFVVDSKA